jgi:hypothetical protein
MHLSGHCGGNAARADDRVGVSGGTTRRIRGEGSSAWGGSCLIRRHDGRSRHDTGAVKRANLSFETLQIVLI